MRSFFRTNVIAMSAAHLVLMTATQVVPSVGYATTPLPGATTVNTATTGTTATSGQGAQNTQQTEKKATFTLPAGLSGNSGGNASDQGNKVGAQQIITAGVSIAMAGYLATQCGPKNPMACAMAAMAASQAASLFGSSGGAKNASNGMSTYDPNLGNWNPNGENNPGSNPTLTGTFDPNNPTGNNPTTSPSGNPATTASVPNIDAASLNKLNGITSQLEKAGYKVSKDGASVTLPDGRQISGASMGSPASMAAAGLSGAEISAAQAALKSAQEQTMSKLKLANLGADGGGGGGGGAGGGGRDPAGGDGSGNMFGKMPWDKDKEKKEKNRLSGMSKKLGNDNIGVAGDDIFEMVTRRYKARDAANDFLK